MRSIPLLKDQARGGLLEVSYEGSTIHDPHLTTLTIRNVGSRDVTSSSFDNGLPIVAKFNQKFYGLANSTDGMKVAVPENGSTADSAEISILPQLLKRGEIWALTVMLSGPAELTLDAPLIDTDVNVIQTGGTDLAFSLLGGLEVSAFGLGIRFPDRHWTQN